MFENLSPRFPAETFPNFSARLAEVTRAAGALSAQSGFRFLDDAEVLKQREHLRNENSDFLDHILFVASDAGGVLYGVWLRGRLVGMWSMYNVDEIDLSPAWPDVDSFIAAMQSGDGRARLPDFSDAVSADQHASWAETRAAYHANFKAQYDADHDSMFAIFFAYSIIALTPRADAATLIPFLHVDNQWIAERAAVALGGFKHRGAIADLKALVNVGGNGGLAARGALAAMGESV